MSGRSGTAFSDACLRAQAIRDAIDDAVPADHTGRRHAAIRDTPGGSNRFCDTDVNISLAIQINLAGTQ
jgi:hypothetical protein